MSATQAVPQREDTVTQGELYMSFELGDKSWKVTASAGPSQALYAMQTPPDRDSLRTSCVAPMARKRRTAGVRRELQAAPGAPSAIARRRQGHV
jgi:hypothetical protein